jgi:alpha/beta superfamily hydrolase
MPALDAFVRRQAIRHREPSPLDDRSARETVRVATDVNAAKDARGVAVLLHPHPDFGGNRFHPFIEALFRRLPEVGVSALRFDFASADPLTARAEAAAAIDVGAARWPQVPVVLAGYSFGAGIAAAISDERVSGWYLLAPPSGSLSHTVIGHDPRPKAIVVPEHDQFSPPLAIEQEVADWVASTVTTARDADHFLGAVKPIADDALNWIGRVTSD